MLHDIQPHVYDNAFRANAEPQATSPLLLSDGTSVLLLDGADGLRFPTLGETAIDPRHTTFAFVIDEAEYFLHTCDTLPDLPGSRALNSGALRNGAPEAVAFAALLGLELARWYAQRRYCGNCGGRTRPSATERAMVCPDCRITEYPKLSPAVIVAVTDGERLLMIRYADRPNPRWVLVAGFCEIGESVEQTVRREVREEVGLDVTDVRYFSSQPWPYSDSLMLGFFCRVNGEQTPHPDMREVGAAQWFSREDIPPDDRPMFSLTQTMIAAFRQGSEPR